MKKLYSKILMLAMMVTALSLTACGGSEDDEINDKLYDASDFIEVTINGKTYFQKMIGIYVEAGIGEKDMVVTAMTEDVFDDDGFSFFLALTHSKNIDKLLSSSLGNYGVGDVISIDDEPENLCLYPSYKKDDNDYKLKSGSHQVTSINKTKYGVQVCGIFKVTMFYEKKSVVISGKYGITI